MLSGLVCAWSAAPAHAAGTPSSWESSALSLPTAHQLSQGEGVTVAVLDTGVAADHPAVRGRVITGPDFREDGMEPASPDWGDHGTAMASDVLKVAPKAKILSVRVNSDKDEGDGYEDLQRGVSPVAKGIQYAVDHGADVILLSLGTGEVGEFKNEDEVAAIGYAVSHGVPLLAGAGNSGDELNQPSAPAGYANVIAVAATKQGGGRADFSTVHEYNEVAAPGVDITSAKNTGGFWSVDGTSPATALASGVVALMLSHNHELTPAQVRAILTSTARHPDGGPNALLGFGQINAAAAVKAAGSPPVDKTLPVKHKGKQHFAAPAGTPKTTHPDLEQGPWMLGLGVAGVGLFMTIGGLLLALLGRRKSDAGAAMTPPSPGPFPI
ncbi:S8 family peptidase [Streptomyces enissocaesilis]|uniref:S8 family peptidase n=1 Tax=Streptomyces enissocaesilis TaxID=332589 RepID=UPI0031E04239